MAERTNIQWCDSTVNPSLGCHDCELWDQRRMPWPEDLRVGELLRFTSDRGAP